MIGQVCSPKELLVGLLEQVEEAHSDSIAETVILLLQPLQKGEEHLSVVAEWKTFNIV